MRSISEESGWQSLNGTHCCDVAVALLTSRATEDAMISKVSLWDLGFIGGVRFIGGLGFTGV